MGTTRVRPAKDPRAEEREARERERRLEKARRAAGSKREREARQTRASVIREELAKPKAKRCRCGLRPSMTLAEIQALGAGCTAGRYGAPGFVCPVLDRVRRRLGR